MTNLRNLKTFLFLVLVTLTIVSCSKKDDPTPVAINTLVTGIYPLTYYRYDSAGVTQSETDFPVVDTVNHITYALGTFTVAAVTNSTTAVKVRLNIVQQGSYDVDDTEQYDLVKDGATYDLMNNGTKYGTIDGKNLSYDESNTNSTTKIVTRLIINARKYD